MGGLLHTCAEESSVHGLPHLVAQDRHWLERAMWGVIVVISIYCSYAVCLSTWTRYQESPTVLTLQTDYRHWIYRPPAITVCPTHFNVNRTRHLIKKIWNVTEQSEQFDYYFRFLTTIANATYNNLSSFEPFAKDSSLATVDMLDIAWNVRYLEFMPSNHFLPVITEMGMCFTSSNYSHFQNASSSVDYTKRIWASSCYSFDLCKSSVIVNAYGIIKIYLFVHTEDEVMTATDIIKSEMKDTELVEVTVWVDQVVASSGLRSLSPARRKCVYPNEVPSHFEVHTPNLCKINCRINRALKLCGCIPFFYNIKNLKKCTPAEMVCLAKSITKWYHESCHCTDLCESTTFTQRSVKVMKFPQLNNQLSVEIFFPKRRIKRSVLFSSNDLIVSFGGAAALFLGCSFLSAVEFFYFFLEFVGKAAWAWKMKKSN